MKNKYLPGVVKMQIDINHIAKLSRLEFNDEQITLFEKQMKDIVKMVEQLDADNDADIGINPNDPMTLRDDVVSDSYPREKILSNAPMVEAGCFVVPKTVDAD